MKHATWLYNRYLLHSDGKTSYERSWEIHYNRSICEFAQTLLYRPAKPPLPTSETHWHYGYDIWLGKCAQSDEHYVRAEYGATRTRDIKRRPRHDRYQFDYLKKVIGALWGPRGQ